MEYNEIAAKMAAGAQIGLATDDESVMKLEMYRPLIDVGLRGSPIHNSLGASLGIALTYLGATKVDLGLLEALAHSYAQNNKSSDLEDKICTAYRDVARGSVFHFAVKILGLLLILRHDPKNTLTQVAEYAAALPKGKQND
jgi:hypothetical protein